MVCNVVHDCDDECDYCYVLVLRVVKNAFSESTAKRLYVMYEMVQFARELCLLVITEDSLPGKYDVGRWLELTPGPMEFDVEKRSCLREQLSVHRAMFESDEEFERALDQVENLFIAVALECLNLPGVRDPVCVAACCVCPPMLLDGDEEWMRETAAGFLDLLHGHLHIESDTVPVLLDGYLSLLRGFRAEFTDDDLPSSSTIVSVLLRLTENHSASRQFVNYLLCLLGGCRVKSSGFKVCISDLSDDFAGSICQTVYSWCEEHAVRTLESLPHLLVESFYESVTRGPVVSTDLVETMWSEVGRVATADYRSWVYERLGYNTVGQRMESPEIPRRLQDYQ